MMKITREIETQPLAACADENTALVASIVSSPAEILELTPFVSGIEAEPGMLAPRFFLASIVRRNWKPCVVVVSKGSRIAGLLFCKERILARMATGIAFGDATLGGMIAARPEETESVFHCAVEALFKHMVALRFRVGADQLALMESVKVQADIYSRPVTHHAHLELPKTYDAFLKQTGLSTRRNLRRYRRRSEAIGNEFSAKLDFAGFCTAARTLFANASYKKSKDELERALEMISAMPKCSQLMVGIRRANGEWVALAGGWHESHRVVLNVQLNDCRCGRESISIVLRSYLIEMLISQGFQEIVFWAGTSGPFRHYTVPREEFMTYVDARSYRWRLARMACSTLTRHAPRTLGKWLTWVAPSTGPAHPR
jgi:hypothetical protein